jgi:16S rRNA (guanine527-N7)-methyltransferase
MSPEPETPQWKRMVVEGAAFMGIPVSPEQADRFALHAAELIRWNRKMNLTAITDPEDMAVRHFLDSIAAAPLISPGSRLLDIGSGGGFPGIPLKVMVPSLRGVLVDSVHKKVSFMSYLVGRLGLTDMRAVHGRAEDLARDPAYGRSFDVVV